MASSTKPTGKSAYHHGDLPQALVREAVKLIRKRGDLNFSLRDLAAQLGVSHAAVYRHYSSKSDLLAAVAIHAFELLAQAIKDASATAPDNPTLQLARQGAAYVGFAMQRPGHFTAMFAPDIHQSPRASEVMAAAETSYQLMSDCVARRQGNPDPLSPSVQVEALRGWAMVHGLAQLQLSGQLAACLGTHLSANPPQQLEALVMQLLNTEPAGAH